MCVLLVSCYEERDQEEAGISSIEDYFDVKGLLAEKREQLIPMEVLLEKKASFAGEVEKTTIRLDSLALKEEFDVFREVDINKPVLVGRYFEKNEVEDGKEVILYEADDKESLNVNYLKIVKDTSSDRIEQIEALFSNRNVLYNSTRLVTLYFDQVKEQVLPQRYTIKGSQKMIFSDKENYSIEANFIYPD